MWILINLTDSVHSTEVAATLDRRPQVNAVIHEVTGPVAGVNGQLVAVIRDDDTHGQLGASDLQHSLFFHVIPFIKKVTTAVLHHSSSCDNNNNYWWCSWCDDDDDDNDDNNNNYNIKLICS